MKLVLQVENLATGTVKKISLKQGVNSFKLPKGAKAAIVDRETGHVVYPLETYREGDDARLVFSNDGQTVELTLANGLADAGAAIPQGLLSATLLDAVGAAAASDAAAATAAAAAGGGGGFGSVALIVLGLAGLGGVAAAAGGGGGGSSSGSSSGSAGGTSTPAAVQTAAPTLALGAGVSGGATSAEATAAGGVVTVNAASGATVSLTFTNGSHTVTKSVTGTGAAQAVVLTVADLATLGDGIITVSATATASGQAVSTAATANFTLDTAAPQSPVLALGAGVAGGATAAEATAAGGVVTVSGEAGASIVVTFTDAAGHVVSKTVTGTGAAQAVVLSAADAASLFDGLIRVSASATDAAGNASAAGATSFTLDTSPPAAPTLAFGAGVAGGATAAEATATGGVVSVSAESGAGISVTFTNGSHTVTKSLIGTGAAQAVALSAADLVMLGDGAIQVNAVATDAAGNSSATGASSFMLDTVAPQAPVLALGTGVSNGATAAEATAAGGVVTVSGEAGAEISVTFTNGSHTVTKSLTGTGAAQAVALSASDLAVLGDGAIQVNAVATDAAGNLSLAGTAGFTLDTVPPASTLNLGAGVADGATAAEATAAGGVVTVAAEAGSTIVVTLTNGIDQIVRTLAGTGSSQAVRLSNLDVLLLGNGPIAVTAVATDAAGNVGRVASTQFTLDTVAPGGLLMFPANNIAGGATAGEAVSATGLMTVLGEAGSTIAVTFTDSLGHAVIKTVTGTGALQAVALTPTEIGQLADGAITAWGAIHDAAGNAGTPAYASLVLDTRAPTVAIDAIAVDGVLNAAEHGNGLVITGTTTAENGQIVTVSLNGHSYAGIANDGTWSVAVGAADVGALNEAHGAYTVIASVRDAAGNVAEDGSRLVRVDATAPVAPVIAGISDDTGAVGDHITSDTSLTLNGTAEANSTVTLFDGNTLLGTVSADASGNWIFADSRTLLDGTDHAYSAKATDAAGNTGAVSDAYAVHVDTTAPEISVFDIPKTDDGYINQATVPMYIQASTDAARVEIFDGNDSIGFAERYVTSRGQVYWTFDYPATDGSVHSFSAVASDAAGNVGDRTAASIVHVDTTPPTKPVITGISSDSGVPGDLITNDNTLIVNGTGEAGSRVWVWLDTIGYGQEVTVDQNGQWTADFTDHAVPEGRLTIYAEAYDRAYNWSETASLPVIIDLSTPAPTLTSPALTKDAMPVLTGTAEVGTTVTVKIGGATFTTVTDGAGYWSIDTDPNTTNPQTRDGTLTLDTNGHNAVLVTAADLAGNVSTVMQDLVIDTTPPALTMNPVSGDDIINAREHGTGVIVSGTTDVENGRTVGVYLNGHNYTGVVENGVWSVVIGIDRVAELPDGWNGLVRASVDDPAGNRVIVDGWVFVDTTAPALGLAPSASTLDPTPVITGTAEAGATVKVVVGGATYSVVADQDGAWSVDTETVRPISGTLSLNLDGGNIVSAQATDAAGNESAPALQLLTIVQADTTPPAVPTITAVIDDAGTIRGDVANGKTTDDTQLVLRGTAEANALILVNNGESQLGTTQADANGNWTYVTDALSNGLTYDFNVVAVDAAKNASLASTTRTVTIDTTAPAVEIASAALTNNSAPIVFGTVAQADAVVVVTINGATYTATANGDGIWAVDTSSAPDTGTLTLNRNGANAVSVTMTDAAGNVSTATQSLVIDTTNPSVAITSTALTNSSGPVISGTAESGSAVTVAVGGATFTTTAVGGVWSVNTATDGHTGTLTLIENVANANTVRVTAADAAGNATVTTQLLTLDTVAPTISINPVARDNRLNLSEHGSALTISGTTNAENGQTVTVQLNGKDYTGFANGGAWSVLVGASDVAALNDATRYGVAAWVADKAGNSTPVGSTLANLDVDLTPPAQPVIQLTPAITNGATAAEATQAGNMLVTAELNSTITVYVVNSSNQRSLVGTFTGTGSPQSIALAPTDPAILGDGPIQLEVTARDAAGNVSAPAFASFTLDMTPPAVAITSAALTKDAYPVVSGTAEAGAYVNVTIAGANYQVTATDGTWSVNTASAVAIDGTLNLNTNGDNAISVFAVDNAGNRAQAVTQTLVIDTTAPALTIDPIAIDNVVNALEHGVGLVISGTTDAGDGRLVTVTLDGQTFTGIANGGMWSVAVGASRVAALTDAHGAYEVVARVSDPAGNEFSKIATFSVDSLAPAAPVITGMTTDSGTPGDHITSDTSLTLSGTAEANSSVAVFDGNTLLGTVVADDTGAWTFMDSRTLADGSDHAYTARATDTAGNTSLPSEIYAAHIDTTAPGITDFYIGRITGDAGNTNLPALELQVVSAGNATKVEIFDGANSLGFAERGYSLGDLTIWYFSYTGVDGATYSFTAQATDAAGNVGEPTSARTVHVDTTAPATPEITGISDDTGLFASDFTTNDNRLIVNGTAAAGMTVLVTLGELSVLRTVVADQNGRWSADFTDIPLADGIYGFYAEAKDAAGNLSGLFGRAVAIDTSTPVPTITSPGLTHDAMPVLTGIAESGATVTVEIGGATFTTIAVDGTWRVDTDPNTTNQQNKSGTLTLDSNGDNPVTVTATDIAGNTASTTQTLKIDTTAPTLMIDPIAGDDIVNAVEHGNGLVITGTTDAGNGQVVTLWLNDHFYTGVAEGGAWAIAIPSNRVAALADGTRYAVNAWVQDAAGNVTQASDVNSARVFLVDTSAPALGLSASVSTTDTMPVITGTAEADALIKVVVGGVTYNTVATGGHWSIATATGSPTLNTSGANLVTVTATDAAGNTTTAQQLLNIAPAVVATFSVTGDLATVARRDDLNQATNITVTGSTAISSADDLAAVQKILAATNSGTTTFDSITSAKAGANSLIPTTNDVIKLFTITDSLLASEAETLMGYVTAGTITHATFDISDTVANVIALAPGVLNAAHNVDVTGTAGAAQANTLFAVQNSGTTTIETVTASVGEAAALALGTNDVLTNLNVTTSIAGPAIINLANIPFKTNITVNGNAGTVAETIYAPAPTMADVTADPAPAGAAGIAVAGTLHLTGTAGDDTFVLTDAVGAGGLPIVTRYVGGSIDGGGHTVGGHDTLLLVGTVDITGLTIGADITTLRAVPGSPSVVTLTAAQAAQFTTINGTRVDPNDPAAPVTQLIIADAAAATQIQLAAHNWYLDDIVVGVNVELVLSLTQAQGLTHVVTQAATTPGDQNGRLTLTGTILGDTDLSKLTGSIDLTQITGIQWDPVTGYLSDGAGHRIFLPGQSATNNTASLNAGQSLTLTASQLQPWTTPGAGALPMRIAGAADQALIIKDDLTNVADLALLDLSGVSVPRILELPTAGANPGNFDLSSGATAFHDFVKSLSEVRLSGNNVTLDVNDIAGHAVTGDGTIYITGTATSPADLSNLVATSGHTIGLLNIGGAIKAPATIASGVQLLISDDQFLAAQQVIANSGTIHIGATGLVNETPDFSGITGQNSTITYDIVADTSIASTANLNGAEVRVYTGKTMTVDADVGSGLQYTGLGNGGGSLVVNGTLLANADYSSLGTLSNVDLTAINLDGNAIALPSTVPAGQTLALSTAEVPGATITAGGNIVVATTAATTTDPTTGDPSFDLSGLKVSGSGAITFAVHHNSAYKSIALGSATTQVDDGVTLTLLIGDAAGHSIVNAPSGTGLANVVLTGWWSAPSSGQSWDLSTITAPSTWEVKYDGDGYAYFSGNLGTTVVSIDSGVVFGTNAAIASGKTIKGAGTLKLDGNYDQAINLTKVETNIDITSAGVGSTLATLPTFASGQTLTLTYAQADHIKSAILGPTGHLDLGDGTAVITVINGKADADLSGIIATTGTIIAEVATDATFTGDFGTAKVKLLDGNAVVLTVAAGKVSNRVVYGAGFNGRVNLTSDSGNGLAGNVNLAKISVQAIDLTAISALAVDATSHKLTDATDPQNPYSVTFGTLATGQRLFLSASQVAGGSLTLAGDFNSELTIVGGLTADVDLGGIDDAIRLSTVYNNYYDEIGIGSHTLVAKAQHIDGLTILSDADVTGTVVLLYNSAGKLGNEFIWLVDIKADIDLTHLTGLTVNADHYFAYSGEYIKLPTLVAGQDVFANASQLTGALNLSAASGVTTAKLHVLGDLSTGTADLTGVADAIGVSFLDAGDATNATIALGSGATLVAKAGQITTQYVTGAGTLKVADNADSGKLTAVTNLTNVSSNIDLTLLSGLEVNNGANLGYLTDGTGMVLLDEVAAAQTLTITAAQAHGGTFTAADGVSRTAGLVLRGEGTLAITGNLSAGKDVDLTGLPSTIGVSISSTLVDGANLYLTAAQADGNTISSSASGHVVIQGIAAAPALTAAALAGTSSATVTSNVSDTAAQLASLGDASLNKIDWSTAKVTATTTATVAQAERFAAIWGDGHHITFAIADTAVNLAAASDAVLANATSVRATTPATIAQAIVLDALTTPVSFAIDTSAASVATAVGTSSSTIVDAALGAATSVTLSGTVSFADAAVLSGLTKIASFAISDSAANLPANTSFLAKTTTLAVSGSMDTASAKALTAAAATNGTIITALNIADSVTAFQSANTSSNLPKGVVGLTINGAPTVATVPGSGTINHLSDTAANLIGSASYYTYYNAPVYNLLGRFSGIVTVTDYASVAQAETLARIAIARPVSGVPQPIVFSVKDTSYAIGQLLYSNFDNLAKYMHGSFFASDQASAANGARIAQLAANYATSAAQVGFYFSVKDTAAQILANFNSSLLAKVTGTVTISGTVTAAEAVNLIATFGVSHPLTFSISDTIANIEAAITSSGNAFLSKAVDITVTDTVTKTQAGDVTTGVTNSGKTTFAGMTDTAANIASAVTAGLTAKVTGIVSATATASDDLRNISGNLDLTGTTGLGTDADGHIRMSSVSSRDANGIATITTYTVALPGELAGRTLYVTAAHIAGTALATLGGTGTINIADGITASTSLLNIGSGVQVSFVNAGETGAYGTAALSSDAVLKVYDNQLDARNLTGSGTIELHGRTSANGLEALSGNVDITGVTANIDLTALDLTIDANGILGDAAGKLVSSGTDGKLVLQLGQTVSLSQSELFGAHQLAVTGTGVIGIRGDISSDLDLTYLAREAGVTLSFFDPGEAGTFGRVEVSGTAQTPVTLKLAASQASNQMITGHDSTILVPYRADVPGSNLSASTNLTQVASTVWKSALDLKTAITTAGNGWAMTGAGAAVTLSESGQVVLSNSANNSTAAFTFTAPKAGVYSFAYTVQGNNYGSSITNTVTQNLDGTSVSTPSNYLDYFSVSNGWTTTGYNVNGGSSYSGSFQVVLAQGQSASFQIANSGANRTDGANGFKSSASTITITSTAYTGGFSAIGGTTTQTLDVEVGASTDLSGASLLQFASVDRFLLQNAGTVLQMTSLAASSHVVQTSDGYGSVLLTSSSQDGGYGFIDLTKIAVPVAFVGNTYTVYASGVAYLTPEQANGVSLSGGKLVLVGDIADGKAIDLTRLSSANSGYGAFYMSAVGGFNPGYADSTKSIKLGADAKLIVRPDQIRGNALYTVSNSSATPGTLYIVGDIGTNGSIDLRGITAGLSFNDSVQNATSKPVGSLVDQGTLVTRTSTETGLGTIAMNGNATMYVNGAQISGQSVTGGGSNQIFIYSDAPSGADYSHLTASIDVTNASVGRVQVGTTSYFNLDLVLPGAVAGTNWTNGQTLTLTGAQANNLELVNTPAQVLVTNVQSLMSGGVITADFTHINPAAPDKVTLEFGYNPYGSYIPYAFSGSFKVYDGQTLIGSNHVLIDRGVELKLTGERASGIVFNSRDGLGAVAITGITGETDLTQTVNVPSITIPGVKNSVNVDLSYAVAGGNWLTDNSVSWVWSDATSGYFKDSGGNRVLLPTFDGNSLIVDFRQLAKAYNDSAGPLVAPVLVAGDSKTATLIVKGAITSSLDVTNLNSQFNVRFSRVMTSGGGNNAYYDVYTYDWYGNYTYNYDFQTSIDAGQTLTMRANQTYSVMYISGAGTVKVTTDFDKADVNLGGVTAKIDLRQLSGDASMVYTNGSGRISYNSGGPVRQVVLTSLSTGQDMYVNSSQIDGVNGLSLTFANNAALDTHATLHIAGNVLSTDNDKTLNLLKVRYGIDIAFDNNTVDLVSGGVIKARLDQAATFKVTGTGGTVAFGTTSTEAALANVATGTAVNLSLYKASLDFSALANRSLAINADGKFADSVDTTKTITLPSLEAGQSIIATASEMIGKLALAGSGGTVNIQGNLASGTADLTGINNDIAISFYDTLDGASASIRVTSSTLVMNAVQASGKSITSDSGTKTGTVVLKGALLAGGTDLSQIAANIDLMGLTGLSVDAASHNLTDATGSINTLITQAGQTVKVDAGQLTGGAFTVSNNVSGNGTLDVQGDISGGTGGSNSVNLSSVADGVSVSFADATSNNIAVSGGNSLTLKAVAANGKTITSDGVDAATRNSGTVVVAANTTANASGTVNLSSITADIDLTKVTGLSYVTSANAFKGADGIYTLPSLAAYQSLSLTAAELAGAPVLSGAAGSVLKLVTDPNTSSSQIRSNTDLTHIADDVVLKVVNAGGSEEVIRIDGSYNLTVKAAQANSLWIGDAEIPIQSGEWRSAGTVVVKYNSTGKLDATAIDLSRVHANVDLTALTNLKVDAGVLTDSAGGSISFGTLDGWQTLSLTSEQLAGGGLTLSGTASALGGVLSAPILDIRHDIGNDVDLSQVGDAVKVAFSSNVSITGAYTLTAKTQAISGQAVGSAADVDGLKLGTVKLVDLAEKNAGSKLGGDVDLTHILANIDLTALTGVSVQASGKIGDNSGAITIANLVAGQSLNVAADLLTGNALMLAGATGSLLNVAGDLTTAGTIDLTAVTVGGVTFKDSATDTTNSIQLADGGTLKLNAPLADGLTVSNSGVSNTGRVLLNGNLADNRAISLANVTSNIDLTSLTSLTVNASGAFARTGPVIAGQAAGTIATLALVAGQTLYVNSTQLSAEALVLNTSATSGGSTLDVAGDIVNDVNLSSVASDIALNLHGSGQMLLVSGATLTMKAAQLGGQHIASGQSAGTVAVVGTLDSSLGLAGPDAVISTNIDLTQLNVTAGVNANTFVNGSNTLSIGSFGAGQSLIVKAGQANTLNLTGAGTLVLENDSAQATLANNVDLGTVGTSINLTHLTGLTTGSSNKLTSGGFDISLPSLDDGQTLSVKAGQITGNYLAVHSVTGATSATVNIQGNIAGGQNLELRGIDSPIAISFADAGESSATIAVNGTLTMSVSQASGQSVTGTGWVDVWTSSAGPVEAALSGIMASTSILHVNDDVTLTPVGLSAASSVLGTMAVEVLQPHTLTVDAEIIAGHSVTGAGTLNLTGAANGLNLGGLLSATNHIANLDIRQLTDGAQGAGDIFTPASGNYSVTVGSEQTLYLKASQLSGNEIHASNPVAHLDNTIGYSNAVVDALLGGSYDFSHVVKFTGGNLLTLNFTDSGPISSSNASLLVFNKIGLGASAEYSIGAAQADNIAWNGAGSIKITDGATTHAAAYHLNDTTHADTFIASGSGELNVALGTDGVSDTLKFSGQVTHDFTVSGFSMTATDTSNDVLDFSNLAGITGHTSGTPYTPHMIELGSASLATDVIGNGELLVFTNTAAADATAVYNLFKTGNYPGLNSKLGGTQTAELMLIENGSGDTNIWLWQDSTSGTGADHKVQANELHNLGTLSGISNTDLNYLQSSHILG